MEFQPSADMSWQSWACNELNQAATYPSPYDNVNKANLSTMGGSIGCENGLWKPYTNDVRKSNLSAVKEFCNSLPSSLNGKQIFSHFQTASSHARSTPNFTSTVKAFQKRSVSLPDEPSFMFNKHSAKFDSAILPSII